MSRTRSLWVAGVMAAIVITTAMDATGLSLFSALPLFPLAGLFWYLERHTRVEVGLNWGAWRNYVPALAYPALVLGAAVVIALLSGATHIEAFDVARFVKHVAINSLAAIPAVVLTEEGFFRGWLWASLARVQRNETLVLVWSSVAFSLWHLSAVSLQTGFDLPAAQIPIFMLNATLLGAIWGMLRWVSNSVVVASVSHAVWNAFNYELFGFGTKVGSLGITNTYVFGTETGWVGLALNCVFAAGLWYWIVKPQLTHREVQ